MQHGPLDDTAPFCDPLGQVLPRQCCGRLAQTATAWKRDLAPYLRAWNTLDAGVVRGCRRFRDYFHHWTIQDARELSFVQTIGRPAGDTCFAAFLGGQLPSLAFSRDDPLRTPMAYFTSLQNLFLCDGTLPPGLVTQRLLRSLAVCAGTLNLLCLEGNGLTNDDLAHLPPLPNLKELILAENRVGSEREDKALLPYLGTLPRLTYLDLSEAGLHENWPIAFGMEILNHKHRAIVDLFLDGTSFTEVALCCLYGGIRSLPRLMYLSLTTEANQTDIVQNLVDLLSGDDRPTFLQFFVSSATIPLLHDPRFLCEGSRFELERVKDMVLAHRVNSENRSFEF